MTLFKSKLYDKKWALQKVIYNVGSSLFIFKGVLRLRYTLMYTYCIMYKNKLCNHTENVKTKNSAFLKSKDMVAVQKRTSEIIFSLLYFLVLCYPSPMMGNALQLHIMYIVCITYLVYINKGNTYVFTFWIVFLFDV